MKVSSQSGRYYVQLDSTAFVGDQELIEALDAHSTPVSCGSDYVLFRQGDPAAGLYIVRQGVVTLSMISQDGKSLFAVHALPGSLLGLPGVISGQPYSLSATARSGAQIGFVGRDEFTALMNTHPRLSLKMLKVLAAEVRSARKALY
ncbi:MAG: cyclic nucleotide-binding domain-containing protein [Terracidiphilus sp.]|jgi:CRP/FNR family transcriptional regulator